MKEVPFFWPPPREGGAALTSGQSIRSRGREQVRIPRGHDRVFWLRCVEPVPGQERRGGAGELSPRLSHGLWAGVILPYGSDCQIPFLGIGLEIRAFNWPDSRIRHCWVSAYSGLGAGSREAFSHGAVDTMIHSNRKHLLSFLILIPMLFLALGSYDEESTSSEVTDAEVEHRVDASEIFAEYEANSVRAEQRYKDTVVAVSGRVDSIGRDIMDTPYITLETGELFGQVQCMLAESHVDLAASVDSGDQVTLKGRVDGKMGNLIIRGCQAE